MLKQILGFVLWLVAVTTVPTYLGFKSLHFCKTYDVYCGHDYSVRVAVVCRDRVLGYQISASELKLVEHAEDMTQILDPDAACNDGVLRPPHWIGVERMWSEDTPLTVHSGFKTRPHPQTVIEKHGTDFVLLSSQSQLYANDFSAQ